jgi:predicted Zn finger-like uncharacterized protein
MFITCQECNTTFRLDERLLKTIGSKVRCSQCRYTFVAIPPSAGPTSMAEAKTPAYEALAEEAPDSAIHEEPEDQSLEGIDLAELDSIMEHEMVASAPKMDVRPDVDLPPDEEEELDEIDLDFDFDAALEAEDKDKPGQASMAADGEASDELSLDMDFEIHDDTLILRKEEIEGLELASLTLEEEPVKKPEKIVAKADFSESSLEEDLDMAFKDLELDDEESAVRQSEDPKGKDQGSDDLDLQDVDLDLERPSTERGGDDIELSLADETEQGLDEAPASEKSGLKKEASEAEDDLSLMDLAELELEEPAAEAPAKDEQRPAPSSAEEFDFDLDLGEPLEEEPSSGKEAPVEDELSLDFESDFKTASEKTDAALIADKDGVEDLEELSFEMDADFDVEPAAKAEVAEEQMPQDEGDIDLSDIEQMLGDDAVGPEKAQPAAETEKTKTLRIDDEIDLSEIESAIDKADEVVDRGPELEEPELELDLGTDEATVAAENARQEFEGREQAAVEPLDLDLELEFEGKTPTDKAKTGSSDQTEGELDLSELAISDLGEEKPATSKAETVHSGDIELDFQIEEDESPAVSPRTTLGRTTGHVADLPIEQTVETKPVEPQVSKRPKPIAPKKKSSKIGIIILLLMLLAAAAGGIYYAVMYMGMDIPYVSEYLKPAPKDPSGITNLTTMDINSKFIENGQSGRLFVITGKVRNGYGMRRNTIRLQGKLFTKGKVLVKTEFSYAGVQISDQELSTLSIAEIKQALNAAPASLDATGNVQPGQTLPFIVVFSDLPPADQLDEFAVELISSLPGQ